MYTEFNYIQLSALQHYLFCPRQCALAYVELNWEENHLTTIGHQMHNAVHDDATEKRKNIIKSHGLYISSEQYGLSGQCDLVEFYKIEKDEGGTKLPNRSGFWILFPVEYKKGKPKKDNSDKVQLCAQALCLEEMLNCSIANGALYYGKEHHRLAVEFDEPLRAETIHSIEAVHKLFADGFTPKPHYQPKCKNCSLFDRCQPKQYEQNRKQTYIKSIFEAL